MVELKSTPFHSASLTIFQIPHATDVPTTHFFATLATCRALAGLVYAPIFFLYFSSEMTRSIRYAMVWSQVCRSCISISILVDNLSDAGTETYITKPVDDVVASCCDHLVVSRAISTLPAF